MYLEKISFFIKDLIEYSVYNINCFFNTQIKDNNYVEETINNKINTNALYLRLHQITKDYSLTNHYIYNINRSITDIYKLQKKANITRNKNMVLYNKILMIVFIDIKKIEKSLFDKQQKIIKKYYMKGINNSEYKAYIWLESALSRVNDLYGFFLYDEYLFLENWYLKGFDLNILKNFNNKDNIDNIDNQNIDKDKDKDQYKYIKVVYDKPFKEEYKDSIINQLCF